MQIGEISLNNITSMPPDIGDTVNSFASNNNKNRINNEINATNPRDHNVTDGCSLRIPPPEIETKFMTESPVSGKSQNISISSISNDDDFSSSAASDSDSDYEYGPTTSQSVLESVDGSQGTGADKNIFVIKESEKPNMSIASVSLNNSVAQFGDQNHFNGPVHMFITTQNGQPVKDTDIPILINNLIKPEKNGSTHQPDQEQQPTAHEEPSINVHQKRSVIILSLAGFFVILLVIIATAVSLNELTAGSGEDSSTSHTPDNPGDGDTHTYITPKNSSIPDTLPNYAAVLRIVTRGDWLAQPPEGVLSNLQLPVSKVIIAHTATEGCDTIGKCVYRVRVIQQFHIESQGWDDIGYNWLVGGDGSVYEGRGWLKEGAHTRGYNKDSICVAFIGTFTRTLPEKRQLDAAQLIIAEGVRLGHLVKNYGLFGHRQFYATESPGEMLFRTIKTWPHFNMTNFNKR